MDKAINIVLCCSAGMSTSLVVEKMQEAAKEKGIEANIKAVSIANVEEIDKEERIDILLLGPQVRFKLNEFKETFKDHDSYVGVIDMVYYSMVNGAKILEDSLKSYNNK